MEAIKMFWIMWPIIWPILAFGLFLAFVKVLFEVALPDMIDRIRDRHKYKAGNEWRTARELLVWLQGLTPSEFEHYVAELFRKHGYQAEAVGKSHDGGVDVILEKNGVKSYVQCKKYRDKTIPVGAVRDFYGSLADRLLEGKGYFVTTSEFTLESEEFAKGKPMELINGTELIKYIHLTNEIEAKDKKESDTVKVCPKCGGELVEKHGKFGVFLGCDNYPKCEYTESMVK